MANPTHLDIIKLGADKWNAWRDDNVEILPDLSGADLSGADLRGASLSYTNLCGANMKGAWVSKTFLSWANLRGVNLSEAHLSWAHLYGAILHGANLSNSDLIGADFTGANLHKADLRGSSLHRAALSHADLTQANLEGANLERAQLVGTDLTGANLNGCLIYGVSVWGVRLEGTKQQNLIITHDGEPTITVDSLEVAQFVYLILNNEKIRDVINTIGKKGVLILGRFSDKKRKSVLEAIRRELRRTGLLPIVFDFERPTARDFTETVLTLAGMSLFIIADITNPKSSPLELQATVPNYMIPFVPIIQKGERPFSMFADLQTKYKKWVLPLVQYSSQRALMEVFDEAVVMPARKKHAKLMSEKLKKVAAIDADELLKKRRSSRTK